MTGQDDDAEFRGWLTRQMLDPEVTSADELAVYRDVFTDGQIRAAEWRAQDAPHARQEEVEVGMRLRSKTETNGPHLPDQAVVRGRYLPILAGGTLGQASLGQPLSVAQLTSARCLCITSHCIGAEWPLRRLQLFAQSTRLRHSR